MLDLHVHVLPGIDDGPRTLDDALALAKALVADGIEHVVATPHIYPGVFDNTPQRIADAFDRLQSAIEAESLPLSMTWAAEVRICPEIFDWLEQRRLPLLDGSLVGPSTALIELPDGQIPVGTDRLMALLIDRGITPLIAHPERNKAVMDQPARLEVLRRMGCCFQLTAGSVLGEFGSRAQAAARHLLDADWADVIASDAHNLSGRKPRMRAAREWIGQHYDAALAERLMVTTPQKIAGVSSFSMESAGQKLVFRDLPAAQQETQDSAWHSGLSLLDTLLPEVQDEPTITSAMPTAAPVLGGDAHGIWSLTDFHINAVVEDLNKAAHQASSSAVGDSLFNVGQIQSPAAQQNSVDEDWSLPDFNLGTLAPASTPPAPPTPPASSPAPQRVAAAVAAATIAPATATVVTLLPPRAVAAVTVQVPASAQTAPQEKPISRPMSAVITPAARPAPQTPPSKGLRLRDLEPLAAAALPRNATAAHTAPAGFRQAMATTHSDMARRGLATTAPAHHRDATAQSEKSPRPAQLPLPADGSIRGFHLSKLPFSSSNRKG